MWLVPKLLWAFLFLLLQTYYRNYILAVYSAVLCEQAVSCQLHGVPPDNAQWSRRAVDWLMNSAISCVVKVLSDVPLTVDILTADCCTSLLHRMAANRDLWDR